MLSLTSPATVADLAQSARPCHPLQWAAMREQLTGGASFAWHVEATPLLSASPTSSPARGEVIATGGLYPGADGVTDLWLAVAPAAAPHMLPLVRSIRLTLAAGSYGPLRLLTATPAGARIARLLGFRPAGIIEGAEIWTDAGSPQSVRRRP